MYRWVIQILSYAEWTATQETTAVTVDGHELVERRLESEKPVRIEYSMTDRSRDFSPIVDHIHGWGVEQTVRE